MVLQVENVFQILVNSVLTGSIYVLVAIGLTMIYRILGFANFAHAEFITFGAYIAYVTNVSIGLSLFWSFIIPGGKEKNR